MHRQVGYLNYLSNSNLDYNNPLNVRRFGAYAGLAVDNMAGSHHHHHMGMHHMGGLAINKNPMHHMAGLAVDNMAGIMDNAQQSPLLYGGLALLAAPTANNLVSKKKMNKKTQKQLQTAGLAAIAAHYIMPMIKGE